jgi:lactate dehydrogenase-like 2-hydroxyacid dehydrogenase
MRRPGGTTAHFEPGMTVCVESYIGAEAVARASSSNSPCSLAKTEGFGRYAYTDAKRRSSIKIIHITIKQESDMKIGFVGLGSMGAPMAKNLVAAGFDVTVFDLDAARMAGLQKVGARISSTLTELAADVDVLMTSLPGPKQSRLAMPPVLALLKSGAPRFCHRPANDACGTRAIL